METDLKATVLRSGCITVAGLVICCQRPGTASGHVFISLEDEMGFANAFVPSSLFEAQRLVIIQEVFLKITGREQIVDNVATVLCDESGGDEPCCHRTDVP